MSANVPAEIAEARAQALQTQVAEAMAVIQSQQTVLFQRAEPLAVAVMDMVNRWCEIAESPPSPVQQACLATVQKWVAAQERAKRVASGLLLPPGSLNGSGLG